MPSTMLMRKVQTRTSKRKITFVVEAGDKGVPVDSPVSRFHWSRLGKQPLHCIETFHTASGRAKNERHSASWVPYVYVRQFDPTFLWKHERSR